MAAIAEENSALFASSEEINQALLNSGLEVDGSGFTSIAYSPVAEVAPSYNSLASVLAAYGQYQDLVGQGTAGDISGETVLAAVTVESEASEASLASVLAAYGQYQDLVGQGTAGDISGETVLAAVTVESEASEASLASVRVAYTKYVDMLEQA